MLPIPDTKGWQNTVAYPKQLLAYLKAGCEIKQVGENRRYLNDGKPDPKYYLIAPNLQWEFELEPRHVQALETLELISVDCCGGNYWISKENFNIPAIKKIPEFTCGCGWQGESEDLKEYEKTNARIY